MANVRTIEQIRHARLLELLTQPDFPTIQSLADKIERSHAQVSQWKNRSVRRDKDGNTTGVSNIDSASARAIESATGKPPGWMDNDPVFDKLRAAEAGAEYQIDPDDVALLQGVKLSLDPDQLERMRQIGTLVADHEAAGAKVHRITHARKPRVKVARQVDSKWTKSTTGLTSTKPTRKR